MVGKKKKPKNQTNKKPTKKNKTK